MKPGACVISSLLGQPSLTTISELSLRDELFLDYEDKEIFKYLCFQLKCGIKKPPTFEVMRSLYPAYQFVDTPDTLQRYVEILFDTYKRDLINSLSDVLADAKNDRSNLHKIEKSVKLANTKLQSHANVSPDVRFDPMDIYKEPESKGWEYPWAINKVCSTVKKGEFIAMVGNAGSGKTWYALYMSMFWAMRYGLKVFILSKEMSTDSIRGRLACMVAQVPFNRYMSKALTQRDDYRLRIASKAVIERGVQIDLCHTSITEASGMSKIRQKIDTFNPDLIFVDSAWMLADDYDQREDYQRQTQLLKDLKLISMQGYTLLLTTHFNKNGQSKNKHTLGDMGFSGNWCNISSIIMFLEYAGTKGLEESNCNERVFRIVKNRDGGPYTEFKTHFDLDRMNFDLITDSVLEYSKAIGNPDIFENRLEATMEEVL